MSLSTSVAIAQRQQVVSHRLYHYARYSAHKTVSKKASVACECRSQATSHSALSRRFLLSGISLLVLGRDSWAQAIEPVTLPKDYVTCINNIISSLRDSLAAEDADVPEAERRKRAEPAKEYLREFVRKWRDEPAVQNTVSHSAVKNVLLDLSNFYQKNGARARLPQEVKCMIRANLKLAEGSLPQSADKTSQPEKTAETPAAKPQLTTAQAPVVETVADAAAVVESPVATPIPAASEVVAEVVAEAPIPVEAPALVEAVQ